MSTSSIRIFTLALMAAHSVPWAVAAARPVVYGQLHVDNWTVTAAPIQRLTLTSKCSPYTVDSITVEDGGVLTIEAGATLKFSDNT